ncbi:MAG: DUF4405 domain-containing protein [Candidatus Aenigmatarchaeota archaeon]
MQKARLDYIVDFLMAISFIVVSISGLVLGAKKDHRFFLGITRKNWIGIHNLLGIALILFVLIHLILHWKWMVRMTKYFFRKNKVK